MRHGERHKIERSGWLRAGVLGANDGLISTASLVIGVAASGASSRHVLVSGVAALLAGALSMAAGEYVSVSSQADSERADVAREKRELAADAHGEHAELTAIYVGRGLTAELASEVAKQMMAHDALGAHMRDELGITATFSAKPMQAALASAGSFAVGALPVLLALSWAAQGQALWAVGGTSILGLIGLGLVSARLGGAPLAPATWRVTLWGAAAMALTAGAGRLFGA